MRTADRILSVALALLGFALGILVVVEVIYAQFGNSGHVLLPYEPVATFLRGHAWKSVNVVVIGAALALAGLVLLLLEVKRRRPDLVVLRSDRDDVTATMSTRSVGRAVGSAVGEVSGVASTRTKVRRNTVTVTARTALHDAGALESQANEAGVSALQALDLLRTPKLKLAISQTREG